MPISALVRNKVWLKSTKIRHVFNTFYEINITDYTENASDNINRPTLFLNMRREWPACCNIELFLHVLARFFLRATAYMP